MPPTDPFHPPATTNPATPEAIATLRAHPNFPAAMRTSAAGLVTLYQGGRLVRWLMDDRGRLVFGYFALYLHLSRRADEVTSGLTPTRMKALCAEFEVCSPGRVVALLSLMRFAGYLAPAAATDRRLRGYVATDRLVALMVERWRIHFGAMAMLRPEGQAALAALHDTAFRRRLVIAMFRRFRAGFRFLTHAPELGLFADRDAGMLILSHLLTAAEEGDATPPHRPVPISIAALARRFHVSRPHVLKLLNDAAEQGFIRRTGAMGEGVLILPRLAEAAQNLFATMYFYYVDCLREALSPDAQAVETSE
jgi:hypothetical protein